VVLGGLLRERKEELRREVPGLGRVPVLGALFRRNSITRSKTEIAVLITPQIVREALPTGAIAPQVSKQREGEAPWDADFVLALSNAL
jgi:general secretion pathway protein D